MHELKTQGRKEGREGRNIYKGHQTTQEGDTQALAVEIEKGTKSALKLENAVTGEKLFSGHRKVTDKVSRSLVSRKTIEAELRLWITLSGRSRAARGQVHRLGARQFLVSNCKKQKERNPA